MSDSLPISCNFRLVGEALEPVVQERGLGGAERDGCRIRLAEVVCWVSP